MKKKVAIHNLGCKVNAYESDIMRSRFTESGYETVPFSELADIYVINTCCVTAVAEKKSRQMLHKARKMNENAIIAAVGCYSQIAYKTLIEDGTADIIIGSKGRSEIVRIIESGRRGYIEISDDYEAPDPDMSALSSREHTRGFIKIEDGCDNFCSYCIIPYARGRVRSRRKEDVLSEIRSLAEDGCREVVLSGINISSYGKDRKEKGALEELIIQAAKIDGIDRIRLGSIEPVMITKEFLDSIGGIKKLCPHFHLSLQSGSEMILRAMNRHYTPDEYLDKCRMLREYFEEPSITTDIIVGFPGEDDEKFKESYEYIKKAGFFRTHVFPYSKREGTAAARMKSQIPMRVKKERVKILLELNDRTQSRYLEREKGRVLEVLFEEEETIAGRTYISGHTKRYEKVIVPGDVSLINTIRKAEALDMIRDNSEELALLGNLY